MFWHCCLCFMHKGNAKELRWSPANHSEVFLHVLKTPVGPQNLKNIIGMLWENLTLLGMLVSFKVLDHREDFTHINSLQSSYRQRLQWRLKTLQGTTQATPRNEVFTAYTVQPELELQTTKNIPACLWSDVLVWKILFCSQLVRVWN